MISAFAHQITELEQKVCEQNETVNKIFDCLTTFIEQKKGETLNVSARIKENQFRLNDLCSKLKNQGEELKEVRGLVNGANAWQEWNPGIEYHQIHPEDQRHDIAYQQANHDWHYLKSNTAFAEPGTPVSGNHAAAFSVPMPEMIGNENGPTWQILDISPGGWGSPQKDIEEMMHVDKLAHQEEILFYKRRIEDLEHEVKLRDDEIADIQNRGFKGGKDGWADHKLKLLKQDKRRRGETIGKLLKCIDSMRDHSRMDVNKVAEGKAVLAATLASQGLPIEERVRRTVRAAEFDGGPGSEPLGAVAKCDGKRTGYNKNNSAKRDSLTSLATSSGGESDMNLIANEGASGMSVAQQAITEGKEKNEDNARSSSPTWSDDSDESDYSLSVHDDDNFADVLRYLAEQFEGLNATKNGTEEEKQN